jgi:uncharacterized protein (DUF885 family)
MDQNERINILNDVAALDETQIEKALSGDLTPEIIEATLNFRDKARRLLSMADHAIEGGYRPVKKINKPTPKEQSVAIVYQPQKKDEKVALTAIKDAQTITIINSEKHPALKQILIQKIKDLSHKTAQLIAGMDLWISRILMFRKS